MAVTNFIANLKKGKKGENIVVKLFKTRGISSEKNREKGRLENFDLMCVIADRSFTVEVKYDLYASKSGNLAFEFYNPKSGFPSGIASTKSDLWVQVLTNPSSVWAVNTKMLKLFMINTKPLRIITAGGDGNASLFLYEKHTVLNTVLVRLDNLPPVVFLETLTMLLR